MIWKKYFQRTSISISRIESSFERIPIMNENIKEKQEELYKASLPLLDFMNKYYCPHDKAILTEGLVEIVRGDMGITLPVRD